MLIGYVSDERYIAQHDVAVLFENEEDYYESRSLANGAIYADLKPGLYQLTLRKEGYSSKRVKMTIPPDQPVSLRMLSNKLVGYM